MTVADHMTRLAEAFPPSMDELVDEPLADLRPLTDRLWANLAQLESFRTLERLIIYKKLEHFSDAPATIHFWSRLEPYWTHHTYIPQGTPAYALHATLTRHMFHLLAAASDVTPEHLSNFIVNHHNLRLDPSIYTSPKMTSELWERWLPPAPSPSFLAELPMEDRTPPNIVYQRLLGIHPWELENIQEGYDNFFENFSPARLLVLYNMFTSGPKDESREICMVLSAHVVRIFPTLPPREQAHLLAIAPTPLRQQLVGKISRGPTP